MEGFHWEHHQTKWWKRKHESLFCIIPQVVAIFTVKMMGSMTISLIKHWGTLFDNTLIGDSYPEFVLPTYHDLVPMMIPTFFTRRLARPSNTKATVMVFNSAAVAYGIRGTTW